VVKLIQLVAAGCGMAAGAKIDPLAGHRSLLPSGESSVVALRANGNSGISIPRTGPPVD